MADDSNDQMACEQTHAHGACEQCGGALPPPSPKWHGKVRRFCRNACRSAWRRDERDRHVQAVIDAAVKLQALLRGKA